jgi:hypothetical protein
VPLRALLVLLLLLPPLAGPLRAAEGDEALRERAREIRLVVESITGIPFPRPVEIRIIGKPEVRPFFEEEIARELPTGKIDFLQRSFIRLGMAEPDFDLEEAFLDLVSSQVAGFYHSREEVLYLIRGMAAQEMILAHELTHALQDQIDDLDGTADALDDEHRDDALAAYQALYEGEAMIVMAQHFAKTMDAGSVQDVLGMLAESGAQSAVLERAPLFLRESLIFPYTYGQTFATRAFNGGTGFGPLRRLFRDPPASTEQILHPYKYYDTRDRPTRLALRDLAGALGPRWRRLGRSELGEAGAGWLLRHHGVGQLEAMRAARGWDGDAFVLLAEAPGPEKGEAIREGLVWVSTWDSAAHAHRFRKAFEAALTETHGRPDAHLAGGGAHWTRPGDTAILLRRWGREVVFLNGFREPELTALRARLTRLKTSGALFAEDHRDDAAPPPAGDE